MTCQVPACSRKVDLPEQVQTKDKRFTVEVCPSCAFRLVERGYSRVR
jgi:hypothetical protein